MGIKKNSYTLTWVSYDMAVWDGESISLLVILLCGVVVGDNVYVLDDTPGLGRVFDGIGGLSGGGVSRGKEYFILNYFIY